jgi:hypothetical protein
MDATAARPIAAAVAGWETAMSDSHNDNKITTGTTNDVTVTDPADAGPARPSATRRSRRPRGATTRARVRARRGLILPAAVAGTLAAALLGAAPAHAGTSCNLRFYYNYDGSPAWPSSQVSPGPFLSCSLPPAIVRYNGGTTIAATSATAGAFETFVNTDYSPNWWKNDGWGGSDGGFGAPAMTPYSGGTEFAITYSNALIYDWETGGSPAPAGRAELIASSGIAPSAPAMARTSGATEMAATGTDNSLWFYWNIDGTPNWGSHQIVGPSLAYGTPAIVADDSSTEVAFIAPDASLWFYWIINGTTAWHPEEVSGPGTVWGGVAMTHSYGGIQIAAPGPGGSIMFFWAADGTSTWHPEQVAGPGTMQGAPAMIAGHYTMEIAVTATDGSLRYYWSYDGTPTWYGAQIAPPGTASTSPAMTRFNGGTEIAVAGP